MAPRYRVALIGRSGHGDYGHALDSAWDYVPEADVVAVADDDPAGLARARRGLNRAAGFLDYREMLETVRPDIVTICPRWVDKHHEMAIAAAERGIHIYMEKPLCGSVREARDIVEICEDRGVKCVVAHPTRFSPMLAIVQKLIAEGAIGEVLEFRARGKEDIRDGRHRSGTADLLILGSHLLHMMAVLGGSPNWCFGHVQLRDRPVGPADGSDRWEGARIVAGDTVSAVFGMKGGVTAHFASRRAAGRDPSRYGLQIFGTDGILEILEGPMPPVHYLDDPAWSPGRSGKQWRPVSSAGIGVPEPLTQPQFQARHYCAVRELLDAIAHHRRPIGDAREVGLAVAMIEAVFESHRRERPVPIRGLGAAV